MATNLNIADLQPGMVIVRVTAQNGPVKIRKSGLVTSFDMVRGLAEMGVQQVEIDPQQTVEIDAPPIEKSQTQKLLERDYSAAAKLDHSLSEQFNRSLFLPSVQDIPNLWQYYGKQFFVAMVIFVGGFGIGWSGANYQTWLVALNGSNTQATPDIQAQNSEAAQQALPAQQASNDAVNTGLTVEANTQSPISTEQIDSPAQPAEDTFLAAEEPVTPEEEQGVELTGQPQEPQVAISADLLRRFEAAVAAVDESEPEPAYEADIVSMSDIPKVHELPARILTRLPSMAFSAHMYASEEENRWVRVNGKRVAEGEWVEDGLKVVSIEPQHVVMSFNGEEFAMAALTDW